MSTNSDLRTELVAINHDVTGYARDAARSSVIFRTKPLAALSPILAVHQRGATAGQNIFHRHFSQFMASILDLEANQYASVTACLTSPESIKRILEHSNVKGGNIYDFYTIFGNGHKHYPQYAMPTIVAIFTPLIPWALRTCFGQIFPTIAIDLPLLPAISLAKWVVHGDMASGSPELSMPVRHTLPEKPLWVLKWDHPGFPVYAARLQVSHPALKPYLDAVFSEFLKSDHYVFNLPDLGHYLPPNASYRSVEARNNLIWLGRPVVREFSDQIVESLYPDSPFRDLVKDILSSDNNISSILSAGKYSTDGQGYIHLTAHAALFSQLHLDSWGVVENWGIDTFLPIISQLGKAAEVFMALDQPISQPPARPKTKARSKGNDPVKYSPKQVY